MNLERIKQIENFLSPDSSGVYKISKKKGISSLNIPSSHVFSFDFQSRTFSHEPETETFTKNINTDFPISKLDKLNLEYSVVAIISAD